jgi:hypothetical protein
MKFRAFLLLPLCGVPAWYAGWRHGVRDDRHGPMHRSAVPASAAAVVATEETWESLSVLAPTAGNRWRALELFGRWAATEPRAAAAHLAALPEEGCRLWPKSGALEAFCKVWAARDMEAAWQAVQAEEFKAVRDLVAALRAESHPAEVAADESLGKEVRRLAKLKLAAADSMEAMRLGLFDGSLMGAALQGASDPVALWREMKHLPEARANLGAAISRLAVNSREAAVTIMQDVMATEESPDHFLQNVWETLALTAANPEELKAVGVPKGDYYYEWGSAMRTWDEGVLRSVLETPPGSGDEQKQDRLIFSQAASELLARDPGALLPHLQRWAADGTLPESFNLPADAHRSSPEYAAQVRALIEAAPAQSRDLLTAAATAVLEEFEPAFLIGRIEQRNGGTESGAQAISAQGVLTRWLQQDAAAASAWLQAHPAALDDGEVESVAQKWVGHDPESASAWINTLADGGRKDAAIRGLVRSLTTHDPASASVWAARMSDAVQRARLQEEILTQWRVWEPEAQAAP